MKDNSKLVVEENENMEQGYHRYQLLKKEVDTWQQERGSYWQNKLTLAEKAPYMPVFDLPSDAIIELWIRLNSAAKFEKSESDLREIWERFKSGQVEMDAEMLTRLQMAIGGVAQLASQLASQKEEFQETEAPTNYLDTLTCPVCGENSTLAVLTVPNGRRMMHCNYCSFEWPVKRAGCLFCGSNDTKQQLFLNNEAYPGVEMVVCQICRQYFKEIDARKNAEPDYKWEDIRTLPLNFAAELWLSEEAKKNNKLQ